MPGRQRIWIAGPAPAAFTIGPSGDTIFTDAAVLINIADGAMLVVKANKTRYGVINRLLETVPRERMLGVVLNASDEEMSENHYDYYYDYANKKKFSKTGAAS